MGNGENRMQSSGLKYMELKYGKGDGKVFPKGGISKGGVSN
jgi:hypothetical protein